MAAQLQELTEAASFEKPIPLFTAFAKQNPDISAATLRYQIRCMKTNGLGQAGALCKVGKEWWVFPSRYFRWLSEKAFKIS